MTGVIRFEKQEMTVAETAGTARVAIVRTGDLSGPVTIEYAVTPDTASAGIDYVPKSGFVTMAAGQSRIEIPVQLIDDSAYELKETFVMSIIKVDSGELFAPRTTRIEIADNENPVVEPAQPPLVSDYAVTKETVVSNVTKPMAMEWAPNDPSIMYIAEKGGRIRTFDTDTNQFKADFIDLSREVNAAHDRGLMDIALHPNFPDEPYIYAFYVVDPPDAAGKTGNAGLDGGGNRYAQVVRFEADPATGYTTALAGSKTVLLGGAGGNLSTISGAGAVDSTSNLTQRASDLNADGSYRQDYIKVDSLSHAGGQLEFGPDGALYVSTGDGTSYNTTDPRTVSVQSVDALAGKILRIDPMTGDGLADNPFVESGASLDSNKAKVFQLGLRNPFGMSFDSEGKLIISDTGWNSWEEVNVGGPGANFGWPFYEGGDNGALAKTGGYSGLAAANAFYAAVAAGQIEITPAYRAFSHAESAPGYQVQAIVGGNDVVTGDRYPELLKNDYFFADVSQGEVYAVDAENRNELKFLYKQTGFAPVHFKQGLDGYMYFADQGSSTIGRFKIDGPNLIVNGDFQQVSQPAGWKLYANGQLPGWTNAGGPGIEVLRTGTAQVIDLDSTSSVDLIHQTVRTQIGQVYKLKFDAFGVSGTSDVEVLWNGAVVGTVKPTSATAAYTFEVTGTGGNDRLAFREPAGQNSGDGARLDNISLRAFGTVTVDAVDDAFRGATGQAITGNVLTNDKRPASVAAQLTIGEQPANGTLTLNQDGSFSYTPKAGFSGSDSFTYVVSSAGKQDTATVRLTVDPSGGTNTITGTAGDDYLVDTDANDIMRGGDGMDGFLLSGRGNDTVDGEGGGYNQVELLGAAANYAFARNADGTITVSSAAHGTDTLKNIQGFWFLGEQKWYAADTLAPPGGTGGNVITGTAGDDYLVDTDANDIMRGGDGMDGFLLSGRGNDTVDGEGGGYNQVELLGAAANYAFARNADGTITVSSAAHGTDTLKNIQGFWFLGEQKWYAADTLAPPGGTGGNVITGTAGDDYLVDTDANDIMRGGDGMDGFLLSGRGNDTVDGEGGGYNQVELLGAAANYAFARNADGTITVSSAAHGTDTLKNIQGFWFLGEQKWYAADTLAPPAGPGAMMAALEVQEDDDVSDGSREAAAAKTAAAEAEPPVEDAALAEANDNAPMQASAFDLPDQAGSDADAALPDPHAAAHDFVPDGHHQAA